MNLRERNLLRLACFLGASGINLLVLNGAQANPEKRSTREAEAWKLTLPDQELPGWVHHYRDLRARKLVFELSFRSPEGYLGRVVSRLDLDTGCSGGEVSIVFPTHWWLRERGCVLRQGRPLKLESAEEWSAALEQPGNQLQTELETAHGQHYLWSVATDELLALKETGSREEARAFFRELSGADADPLSLPEEIRPVWVFLREISLSRRELRLFGELSSLEDYGGFDNGSIPSRRKGPSALRFEKVTPEEPAVRKLLEEVKSLALKGRPEPRLERSDDPESRMKNR